tara:strand:+ start:9382 stop:9660 length:279 start_codon:yes stop_codon:yes gene_type:complete
MMAIAKPKIETEPNPGDDVQIFGVFDLWHRGLIPVSESLLRRMIQVGDWKCGTLGRRYVTTGRQHHENVLRHTGRADEVVTDKKHPGSVPLK